MAVAAMGATVAGTVACATSDNKMKVELRKQRAKQVAEALDSREYRIAVSTASPLRGRLITLSGGYDLEVRGDSVFSYLPYFGRAYRAAIGENKGLNFDGLMKNYSMAPAKDGFCRIEFTVNSGEDIYRYRIDVADDGMATIDVDSRYRDRIRFDGEMD